MKIKIIIQQQQHFPKSVKKGRGLLRSLLLQLAAALGEPAPLASVLSDFPAMAASLKVFSL